MGGELKFDEIGAVLLKHSDAADVLLWEGRCVDEHPGYRYGLYCVMMVRVHQVQEDRGGSDDVVSVVAYLCSALHCPEVTVRGSGRAIVKRSRGALSIVGEMRVQAEGLNYGIRDSGIRWNGDRLVAIGSHSLSLVPGSNPWEGREWSGGVIRLRCVVDYEKACRAGPEVILERYPLALAEVGQLMVAPEKPFWPEPRCTRTATRPNGG